ncbi:DUF6161 domain-containing protein [Brevundimonas diminuta]|uniref:DUF6161 domain-containing protein n=1 Tax=Brevundimonas diminuta TaxID=293 RepID=UPI003D9A7A0E
MFRRRTIADEAQQAADIADAEWKAILTRAQQVAQRWAAGRSRKLRAASRTWRDRHANSEASIRAVEMAYREQMGLAAPVDYWKNKASEHQTAEDKARNRVVLFFPAAFISIVLLFGLSAWALIEFAARAKGGTLPSGIYIIASAGLASAAGIQFWVGRLLTKLYLSQHHLRHDAHERATMTETYLALIENEAANPEDKQIILNALFRSTPDGIVKEEGGIDPGLAAALGRLLARP